METRIYHIWFATKRRIWLEDEVGHAAKHCLLEIAREKGIELIECEAAIDHVHLLLRMDKGESLAKAVNLLKSISSFRLRSLFPDLKLDNELHGLWQRGHAFRIVEPRSLAVRRQYVRSQQERRHEQIRKALTAQSAHDEAGMPRPSGRGPENLLAESTP